MSEISDDLRGFTHIFVDDPGQSTKKKEEKFVCGCIGKGNKLDEDGERKGGKLPGVAMRERGFAGQSALGI